MGSTVAADRAPNDQPTAGVGNAAVEPHPAKEEEPAPPKKRAKLNLKDSCHAFIASLLANPPRMNSTIHDTQLRIKPSLLPTKHGLDTTPILRVKTIRRLCTLRKRQ